MANQKPKTPTYYLGNICLLVCWNLVLLHISSWVFQGWIKSHLSEGNSVGWWGRGIFPLSCRLNRRLNWDNAWRSGWPAGWARHEDRIQRIGFFKLKLQGSRNRVEEAHFEIKRIKRNVELTDWSWIIYVKQHCDIHISIEIYPVRNVVLALNLNEQYDRTGLYFGSGVFSVKLDHFSSCCISQTSTWLKLDFS